MKLVVFDQDWSDEFSPFGFALMSEQEFIGFQDYYSKPRSWFFGTNEGYDDEVLITGCTITDITQEDANILTRLFNLRSLSYAYLERGLFPGKPEEDLEDDDTPP